MAFLSTYLLSIMGIIMLFVVIELILPNGQTAKYIRSILGIFLIFVIVAPLGKIKSLDFNDILFGGSAEYQLDYNYLYKAQLEQASDLQQKLEELLANNGVGGAIVIIDIQKDSPKMQINSIFVDLSQTVISKNNEHIINYTTIKDIVCEYASIEKNKVVISG